MRVAQRAPGRLLGVWRGLASGASGMLFWVLGCAGPSKMAPGVPVGTAAPSTFHTLRVLGVTHACSSVGAPSRPGCPWAWAVGTRQPLLGPGLLTPQFPIAARYPRTCCSGARAVLMADRGELRQRQASTLGERRSAERTRLESRPRSGRSACGPRAPPQGCFCCFRPPALLSGRVSPFFSMGYGCSAGRAVR